LDVLIIPGGVHTHELEKPSGTEWIQRTAGTTQLTASVCTGAFLLSKANPPKGKPTTTKVVAFRHYAHKNDVFL